MFEIGNLIDQLRADGASDWQSVLHALSDGEYLASIGVDDVQLVETAFAYAQQQLDAQTDTQGRELWTRFVLAKAVKHWTDTHRADAIPPAWVQQARDILQMGDER